MPMVRRCIRSAAAPVWISDCHRANQASDSRLRGLKRIVDYPARDMTITVEAGITIDALATALAKERHRLPIDLPDAHRATLGGRDRDQYFWGAAIQLMARCAIM